jgi:hypothetical protein
MLQREGDRYRYIIKTLKDENMNDISEPLKIIESTLKYILNSDIYATSRKK